MRETPENKYGDRIGKTEICQGIILIGSIIGLMACACLRGCEEIQKRKDKAIQKAKAAEQAKQISATNRVSYIISTQKQR